MWKQYVGRVRYSKEKYQSATLFQFFSIPIVGPDWLPPICVCISKATVFYTKAVVEVYPEGGFGLCDMSWKYNVAGWPLVALGAAADDDKEKDTAVMGLMMAFGPCAERGRKMCGGNAAVYL